MDAMTLTAYAARRGVSPKAVSKAIAAGRLSASVTRDQHGAPKIADPDLADREWEANTRARVEYTAPEHGQVVEQHQQPEDRRPAMRSAASHEMAEYYAHRSAREGEAARRERLQADLAEFTLAERRGELIPVAQARRDVMERYTTVKTRLLGVPRRLAQQLPHLAAEVVPVVDALLREALEELAAGGRPE
jgi:phage terminase Nu1 subunit (DNA packaging protein)